MTARSIRLSIPGHKSTSSLSSSSACFCFCFFSAVYDHFISKINTVGSQITVCCGYVTYNLITYRTDIVNLAEATRCSAGSMCGLVQLKDFCTAERIASQALCNKPLIPAMLPFLILVSLSFCIGFSTVPMATAVKVFVSISFRPWSRRWPMRRKWAVSDTASLSARLTLFLAVTASYGFAKMPCRYEPLELLSWPSSSTLVVASTFKYFTIAPKILKPSRRAE